MVILKGFFIKPFDTINRFLNYNPLITKKIRAGEKYSSPALLKPRLADDSKLASTRSLIKYKIGVVKSYLSPINPI